MFSDCFSKITVWKQRFLYYLYRRKETLFADYHGLFVRFANTYLQDEAAAEDIAVEGIMYYWENRHSLSSDSNIPAYILEAIKHKCLNYLRHLRVTEDVQQRIMSRYENKTYPEIAAYFSLSVKSVEFHISKALKILKVKLKDYMTIVLFM